MNSLKINSTLPFCATFYTKMPNEKDLITPFEQKTKDEHYYSLNHSYISRSRMNSDVFQLLDPELEVVDKIEVDYTVDSFVRSEDENVNKLVNIFDVLLAKVRLNEAVSNIKQSAYEHETIAKKLRDDAKDLEERIPSLVDGLMEEKGLTSNGRFFNPYSIS